MNPVVEREYAYLIRKAEDEKNLKQVEALKAGLERARQRSSTEDTDDYS